MTNKAISRTVWFYDVTLSGSGHVSENSCSLTYVQLVVLMSINIRQSAPPCRQLLLLYLVSIFVLSVMYYDTPKFCEEFV